MREVIQNRDVNCTNVSVSVNLANGNFDLWQRQMYTLKLLIAFKGAFSCYISEWRNLNFLEDLLNEKIIQLLLTQNSYK